MLSPELLYLFIRGPIQGHGSDLVLRRMAPRNHLFNGDTASGPVPLLFATNPTEALTALMTDDARAFRDLQQPPANPREILHPGKPAQPQDVGLP